MTRGVTSVGQDRGGLCALQERQVLAMIICWELLWGGPDFTALLGRTLDVSVYIGLCYKTARPKYCTELCYCNANAMHELLLVSLQQYF